MKYKKLYKNHKQNYSIKHYQKKTPQHYVIYQYTL